MKVPILDLKSQYANFKEDILKAFLDVFDNTRFIKNKSVKSLEENFVAMHNVKHAIAVSSGTTALYVSLMALGIKAGDEVITTPFTFIATANVIHELGAKPVFVDIDFDTFNIDFNKIEGKITSKTKAIIPVHLFGQAADMDPIMEIANKYDLYVVEDAAQAHISEYKGKRVGAFGDVGCFSLFPGKNLGAFGDGGIVTTNDDYLAGLIREKSNNGIPVNGPKYLNQTTGLNFRLNELTAAIMLTYINSLEEWTKKRNQNAEKYREFLKNVDVSLPEVREGNYHVYHQFTLKSKRRDELKEFLTKNEIDSSVFYPVPLHLLPAYKHLGHKEGDFPISEMLAKEVISIPIGPNLTQDQIVFVCDKIKEFYSL